MRLPFCAVEPLANGINFFLAESIDFARGLHAFAWNGTLSMLLGTTHPPHLHLCCCWWLWGALVPPPGIWLLDLGVFKAQFDLLARWGGG